MTKKIYVLDTSVYLSDFRSIFAYKNNDIIIPLIVLDEIDNNKKRMDSAGQNARYAIRILDQLRTRGNLSSGVRIRKGAGIIHARDFDETLLPKSYNSKIPDHQIIATALTLKKENPKKQVIVVSCDINLRIKCDAINQPTEDYLPQQVVKEGDDLYTGFRDIVVPDLVIDNFYSGMEIELEEKLLPNEFAMLISDQDKNKTALVRYEKDKPLQKVRNYNNEFGIQAKNREQSYAFDLLMNDNIPVVSLVGRAGSGKTLISVAAGLSQVLNPESKYSRLIISRPVQPLGRDIGFLPGSVEEKMSPWLSPIQDNLRFLLGNDKEMLQAYVDKGIVEIEALTYIRGRSIQNAYIVVDECQNISRHEMKTILTRIGNDSKIVLTGDIEQIDNVNLDETTNGLTHAIEKFKEYDVAGHVTLLHGERSKVATIASQIL